MAQALFTNNAFSLLASGITDSATSMAVTGGDGTLFPNPSGGDYFYATLIDTSNNLEIVQCTARSTDTLTIVRGAESTTARAYSAGDRIELRLTAAGITEADGFVAPTDESTDTTCFPLFVVSATGSQTTKTGTNLTFNSNTGALVSTLYDGIIGSVTPAAGSFTTITGSGVASIDDTTDTTSGTDGSIHTDGGVGIAKKLFVGTSATVTGVLTMGGDILSDTDSTDSLGSTGVRWLKLWVDDIQTTADINVGADLVVTGNLTVNGTTTTVATTNMVVGDSLIELNNGAASNANDLGIVMERGSTGDNAIMMWDESGDFFQVGTTTATGASTGNLTVTDAQLHAAGLTLSGTSSDLGIATTIDINGGTIDGTAIGGAATAAGAFTTLAGTVVTASTSLDINSTIVLVGTLDDDTMATATNTTLATSESIKAYTDGLTPAPGIQMTWDTAIDDDDEGAGTIKADNATFASITQLFIDDVDNNGVSINAFVDTLDDPTATNSALIYITKAGSASTAMKVFQVDGAVTSAATYSKVAVTGLVEVGTFSDTDVVGVLIAYSGDNGGGSGDLVASNNLSDVASAATSFGNIKQAATASATGVVELATDAETVTGTDTDRAVTPAGLHAGLAGLTDTTIVAGDAIIFSDASDSGNMKEDTVQGVLDLVPSSPGKNLIINGGFQVNQRAYVSTTNTADGTYMHDRWRSGSADSSYTFSVASPASPQTITIAANDSIEQVIEGANVGTAGTHTISWTGTATARAVVNTQSMSGNFAVSPITVTAVLNQVISMQFTGANAAGGSTEATDTGTLGKVQCELGSAATDFEHRDYMSELARCQRYYCRFTPGTAYGYYPFGTGVASTTSRVIMTPVFPVWMRAAPSQSDSGAFFAYDGGNVAVTGISVNQMTAISAQLYVDSSTGFTQYRPYILYNNNDAAAYVAFDAEL